jgi:hypothetical protein
VPASAITNDLTLWTSGVPSIVITGDNNFGFWVDGAPVLGTGEGGSLQWSFWGAPSGASFTAAGVLAETFSITGAGTFYKFTTAGTFFESFSASGAATFSNFSSTGVLVEEFTVAGAVTFSSFTTAGELVEAYTISGAMPPPSVVRRRAAIF